MRTYSVRLLTRAVRNLTEIWVYIAQDSPHNADRWTAHMEAQIADLATMPHRFAVYPGTEDLGTVARAFLVGDYRVIYRIDEDAGVVLVLHVRQTARDVPGPDDLIG